MKKYLPLILAICLSSLAIAPLQAQWIDSIRVLPLAPLDCNPFAITAFCTSGCNNNTINGSSHTVVGNTITMELDISQPMICTPALRFFSLTENINVSSSGTYTIVVNYVENGMVVTSANQSVVVGSCCPADPAFTSSVSGNICNGDTVGFTASVLNQTSYLWKVNGDSVSNQPSYTHQFNATGTSNVTLIVSDGTCEDSTSLAVNVGDEPIITLDTVIDESCAAANDGQVRINVSGGVSPYSFSWGNGQTTQNQTAAAGGPIWVEVSDNFGCSSRDTFVVGTGTSVSAAFNFKDRFVLCVNDSLNLTNTSIGASNFQWLLDGQPFSTQPNVRISFDSAGFYEVSLIAIDGACRDTSLQLFQATLPPDVTPSLDQPNCPGSADGAIDISLSGGFPPFTFNWSQGARTEDIAMLDSGSFVLLVEDSAGCRVQDTFRLDIQGGLQADFSFTRPNDTVYFQDMSDLNAVSWEWDFGDGSSSTLQNPSHVFTETADFTVCLLASDSFGCRDTICNTISYTVNAEPEHSSAISIYPNPVDQYLFIKQTGHFGAVELKVINPLGQLLISQGADGLLSRIDVSELKKGVYVLIIEGKGRRESRSFVKL